MIDICKGYDVERLVIMLVRLALIVSIKPSSMWRQKIKMPLMLG